MKSDAEYVYELEGRITGVILNTRLIEIVCVKN